MANILSAVFVNIDSINENAQQIIFAILRLMIGISANVYVIGMVLSEELVESFILYNFLKF
jgi:hypothetical protein